MQKHYRYHHQHKLNNNHAKLENHHGENGKYYRPFKNLPTGHEDHLEVLKPLDLTKARSFSDLARLMAQTPFAGREVGKAVDVLEKMSKDRDTFVVMTIAGAMTPAKMGLLICDMIDKGMVNAIVSTGALMAHGLVESTGLDHFWADEKISDTEWYKRGYNRIYRALEPEKNLDEIEKIIRLVLESFPDEKVISSRNITHGIGEHLHKHVKGRGILKSAYEMGVPVFIPAFTDSELGLDLALINFIREENGVEPIKFNPFIDLDFYAEMIKAQIGKKLGIFTIGGGVPRNWAQQIGPYIDLQYKIPSAEEGEIPDPVMFHYAIRICPDKVGWGGLSGCTYEEGMSWGKFWPDAVTCEVLQDATVVWPFIAAAAFERLGKQVIRKKVFTGPRAVAKIDKRINARYNRELSIKYQKSAVQGSKIN